MKAGRPVKRKSMDLIKIETIDGELRVDSRLISQELGVEHKATIQIIRRYDAELSTYGEITFKMTPSLNSNSCQNENICLLNEQQAIFLVTLSRNSVEAVRLKKKLTDSYIYYKSRFKFNIPSTLSEALQLAADQTRLLEAAQPKIEFYDQVADAEGLHSLGEAAKLLGYGRNTFMAKLREMKILMDSNAPYQRYKDLKYLDTKENTIGGEKKFIKIQTFVTGKGLIWLQSKFKVRAA